MTDHHLPAWLLASVLIGALLQGPSPVWGDEEASFSVAPGAARPTTEVETILLTERIDTWLDMPAPPYNVTVTIKQKLERVGYRVTRNPEDPHQAVLAVRYEETPGRTFRFLQQGTRITCLLRVFDAQHPLPLPRDQPLVAVHLQTETGTQPTSSLYWDAVQRLEENPYYYYFGELLSGWLADGRGPGDVFAQVLREPPLAISTEGEGSGLTARHVANELARRGAIEELGRLEHRSALETLWDLAERSTRQERNAALAAIGEVGDRRSVARLSQMLASETDPLLRATIEASLARLQERG